MCQQQICLSNAIDMPNMPIISCIHMVQLIQYIYSSYELNASNNVSKGTGIHTFHIIGICLGKYACHIAYVCLTALLL